MAVLILRAPREPPATKIAICFGSTPKYVLPSSRLADTTAGRTGFPVYTTFLACGKADTASS